ncbi:MAG: glycosyltransferase family 39 protein, partial [Rudaea sp.]
MTRDDRRMMAEEGSRRDSRSRTTNLFERHRRTLLLGLVIIVAAALRFALLDSVPAGPFNDEAVNGLDALRVLRTGQVPIFFQANNGREPLFIYMQTVSVALFGPSAWSLRAVSALAGTATIAALFLLARELFPGPDR